MGERVPHGRNLADVAARVRAIWRVIPESGMGKITRKNSYLSEGRFSAGSSAASMRVVPTPR